MLKLYVLIRDDMSKAQQAVQAGHAVAQFGYDYPEEFRAWQEDNNTLIYLSVDSVYPWQKVLTDGQITHSVFWEPDMLSNTALAVAPNWFCQYLLFKDLPLALQPKSSKWWRR